MILLNLLILSSLVVHWVCSQYASFQHQAPASTNVCAGPSNTSLVEHFFNLIFSEFHNHPPVCVCVQMCPDQPTYCYPNGCFKKVEPPPKPRTDDSQAKYQQTAQMTQLQLDKTKPMSFLADGQNNFMENLLNAKPSEPKPVSKYDDGTMYKELHRDPFKDRYQSIFKYKKTPKVHLRYNLREQVKNRKSDIIKIDKIDVSKTRWPISVNDNKRHHADKGVESKESKYFHKLNHAHSPPRFFKRDVTRLFKRKENNPDSFENSTEVTSFSLENLIENLIESSFGPLVNETELDLNVNLDYSFINSTSTVEPITMPSKRSVIDKNSIFNKHTIIILNETTDVVSINNTNQNIEENKYHDDHSTINDQIYKNVFNDMIASLSRHIEKNNNSSVEMMEQVLGHEEDEPFLNTETTDSVTESQFTEEIQSDITTNADTTADNTVKTTTEVSIETKMTEKETISTVKEIEKEQTSVMRKSHRRILRKLQNCKPN